MKCFYFDISSKQLFYTCKERKEEYKKRGTERINLFEQNTKSR
jgi:hypothetical protein